VKGELYLLPSFQRSKLHVGFAKETSLISGLAAYFVPIWQITVSGFPPQRPGLEPKPGNMGFLVGKVALGQVY
jgi:hypothetical protein